MKASAWRAGLAALLLVTTGFAQGTKEDYARAKALPKLYESLLDVFEPVIQWLPDDAGVFWKKKSGPGYVRVLSATGEREETHRITDWGVSIGPQRLEPLTARPMSSSGGVPVSVRFENHTRHPVHLFWIDSQSQSRHYGEIPAHGFKIQETFSGHAWGTRLFDREFNSFFVAGETPGIAVIDELSEARANEFSRHQNRSSSGHWVWVENHNLMTRTDDGEPRNLSQNGTKDLPYQRTYHFSPDGNRVAAFQEFSTPREFIHVQLPVERWHNTVHTDRVEYRKPGAMIPWPMPTVFDLQSGEPSQVDERVFGRPYRVDWNHWSQDGTQFFCVVIERGHQRRRLLSIDAATGDVSTFIDERSTTFIDSTQKTMLHWLDEDQQFIWASERDGHNHLYLYDARDGALVRQLTQGEYVVRGIDHVDPERREVWFTAYGTQAGQNPTYAHLARVDLAGSEPVVLTEGHGTHRWKFNEDRTLFIDRWSRVNLPTVTELRRAQDGALIAELGRDEFSKDFTDPFVQTEIFAAPGRDGVTPIWGVIVRPSNFEAGRKYPVVERIYAGPHGHHVPNDFNLMTSERRLAELGFIVVVIDGMGTNWRSKKFHDVCWQNLKDAGLPDHRSWLEAAAEKYPELDLERVGIYGGSAGGQNALAALLHHGDFYLAGAADCGCHDNRVDKLWWNEAWMGNPGPHYVENSNVTHAGQLEGKLLLTVGLGDRNVDPACTWLVVDALIRANKDFDFVAVPGGGHGVGDGDYLFRRRQDFFVRELLGVEPRE